MTRVLHIFGQMQRGGAEMRTVELMRTLDPAQVRLDFCVLSGVEGQLDAEIRGLGGEVHGVALDFAFPLRFMSLLRTHRYDAVHAHVHHSSGAILALAARAGTPRRIAHYRSCSDGRGEDLRRRARNHALRALIDRYATSILAVSESAMRSSWKENWRDDDRCRVVYNAIDTRSFAAAPDRGALRRELGIADEQAVILHVGRMTEAKNHRRLIRIFAAHRRERSDSRLALAGRDDAVIGAEVRRLVQQLGLSEAVHLLGDRDDVPRLLAGADLLLFPSLWEGLPGAVLEACAAGTPVLASAIPPVVEIQPLLPLVRSLGLGRGDEVWGRAITEALDRAPSAADIEVSARALHDGPFSMRACREAHLAAWGIRAGS